MSKVLVISPVPTHPQDEGCNQRVFTMVQELRQLGHEVSFLHLTRHQGDILAMQKAWGGDFHQIEYHDPVGGLKKLLMKMRGRLSLPTNHAIDDWCYEGLMAPVRDVIDAVAPDVVMVEYVYLSRLLTLVSPGVLKILDTHDVMSGRHEKMIAAGHVPRWFSCTPEEEARGLERADIVVAIQDQEREFFSQITQRRVVTVGHLVPNRRSESTVTVGHNLLFVGTGNPPNVDAIGWFIKQILPKLTSNFPELRLVLVGKICDHVPDTPHCVKYGRVDDLAAVYDEADVVLNPVRFGTGLKIKSIEALGYAKPLVTTPVGAEGMEPGAGSAFLLARDEIEFADCVKRLLSDKELYEKVCAVAHEFVLHWNRKHLSAVSKLMRNNLMVGSEQ